MKFFTKSFISLAAIVCATAAFVFTSCTSEEMHRGGVGAVGGAIVGGILGGGDGAAAGAIIGGLGGAATARDRYTDYAYPRGPVGRPQYPQRPPSGQYGYYPY